MQLMKMRTPKEKAARTGLRERLPCDEARARPRRDAPVPSLPLLLPLRRKRGTAGRGVSCCCCRKRYCGNAHGAKRREGTMGKNHRTPERGLPFCPGGLGAPVVVGPNSNACRNVAGGTPTEKTRTERSLTPRGGT